MVPPRELTAMVRRLHDMCVSLATNGGARYEAYEDARQEILEEPSLAGAMPDWLRNARSGSQYWDFIKPKFRSYADRRKFLAAELRPLFEIAEIGGTGPVVLVVQKLAERGTPGSVLAAWQKCLDRRNADPEGAITAARTMLESCCKCILDERGVKLKGTEDLPKLYGLVAEQLRLSPSVHDEKVFKQILGGCHSVVEGLGTLRNRLGDAHGTGSRSVRPTVRHAQLAVNLAGAMSTFLIETHRAREEQESGIGKSEEGSQ
jgi:hypothetical protein